MQKDKISMAVIRRLPRYYRYLNDLSAKGIKRVSSKVMADHMRVTASQIRQDLNCFGGFGQQGYGYGVDSLKEALREILKADQKRRAILIGVGNLGHTLINNFDFAGGGFELVAAFDVKEDIVGTNINGIPVYHIDELEKRCSKNPPAAAVLTLSKNEAQAVAERVKAIGIGGIWNLTNVDLDFDDDFVVENVHFSDSLSTLSYML